MKSQIAGVGKRSQIAVWGRDMKEQRYWEGQECRDYWWELGGEIGRVRQITGGEWKRRK